MSVILYASRIMTKNEVAEQGRAVRACRASNDELAVNIIMLRNAAVKSDCLKGVVKRSVTAASKRKGA
ncbi:hypothetical protein [Lysinibacillus sp. 54212]|uniref:hypothetical protein n=1 Tax=Lysinibacillus sp. 54212 TaxID=3119829 RepID=UPI002FCB7027